MLIGRRHQQQAPDRLAEHARILGALGRLHDCASQTLRQRRFAEAHTVLGCQQLAQMRGRGAIAASVEHPREQLLGGLPGLEVEHLLLFAAEHQAGLELQEGGDQHDELGGGLQVKLAARFEMVKIGEHDFGQLQLQQVDLFAQHEREQQIEGAAEDVEVKLERGDGGRLCGRVVWRLGRAHPLTVSIAADEPLRVPERAPTPIRARTSRSVSCAIARARRAPASRIDSSAASSPRRSS